MIFATVGATLGRLYFSETGQPLALLKESFIALNRRRGTAPAAECCCLSQWCQGSPFTTRMVSLEDIKDTILMRVPFSPTTPKHFFPDEYAKYRKAPTLEFAFSNRKLRFFNPVGRLGMLADDGGFHVGLYQASQAIEDSRSFLGEQCFRPGGP
jgi:hypothetical protein